MKCALAPRSAVSKSSRGNEGFRTANLSLLFNVLANILCDAKEMARRGRFELPTPRFVVWCSIQLSYRRLLP